MINASRHMPVLQRLEPMKVARDAIVEQTPKTLVVNGDV